MGTHEKIEALQKLLEKHKKLVKGKQVIELEEGGTIFFKDKSGGTDSNLAILDLDFKNLTGWKKAP